MHNTAADRPVGLVHVTNCTIYIVRPQYTKSQSGLPLFSSGLPLLVQGCHCSGMDAVRAAVQEEASGEVKLTQGMACLAVGSKREGS